MVKRNLGRKKVEMVKMTNESNLNVTFSKRRTGLFKKASEISTLCGVELAIVVFSPGKKVYSFGHPSVDAVIDRYLGRNTPETSITAQLVEGNRESNVHELNIELTQLTSQLEDKRKRGEELNQMKNENQQQYRWQAPVEELDLSTLEQLKSAMEGLKTNVQAQKRALLNVNPNLFYMGNSSGDRVIHDYQTNNNNVAVDENMTDGGYIVNPFPADEDMANPQGHGVNPSEGYNVNPIPADEDMANPQEHGVNPSEGYNVNPIPADEDMANPLDFAIPSPNGFGGEYDDILDTLGFGLQGSEGGFF